jgi:DNA mismatch endonuclease (patch repair protein)
MDAKARSRLMAKIKSSGTTPEVAMGKALWHMGMRYRKQYGKERIDIAFPGKKVAVFVDGCFWHSCPEHGHVPESNAAYWEAKLSKNVARAASKDARLLSEGWIVLHFWEHEVNRDAVQCAKIAYGAVAARAKPCK